MIDQAADAVEKAFKAAGEWIEDAGEGAIKWLSDPGVQHCLSKTALAAGTAALNSFK